MNSAKRVLIRVATLGLVSVACGESASTPKCPEPYQQKTPAPVEPKKSDGPQGPPVSDVIVCTSYYKAVNGATMKQAVYEQQVFAATPEQKAEIEKGGPNRHGNVWACALDAEHGESRWCECSGYSARWLAEANANGMNPFKDKPVIWKAPKPDPVPVPIPGQSRHFECETQPSFGNEERGCLPSDYVRGTTGLCKLGCFSRDAAFCFFVSRSAGEMAARGTPVPDGLRWSPTVVGQDCFASQKECDSFRSHFGSGTFGQPPIKAACILVPANEASGDP